MKQFVFVLVGSVCLLAAPPAQAQIGIGPHVGWSDEFDLGIGARAEFGLANVFSIEEGVLSNLFGVASGTYFFWSCPSGVSCSYFEVNPNAALPVPLGETLISYFGSGLHVGRWSVGDGSGTEVGLNILAGLKFPVAERNAFAEGKFGLAGAEHFTLWVGMLLGRR
jgi:hypothetical protein